MPASPVDKIQSHKICNFCHLAFQAGDDGGLVGERVDLRDNGVGHGVHVRGEVEHEGGEGRLVVVENLVVGWSFI